jgi:hypothetical protein
MSIMFDKLRQDMKRRLATRKRRAVGVRVRGVVERLEERALLSASHGTMGHGHGGYEFGPPSGTDSRYSNSAMIASYQQRSVSHDREATFGHRDSLSSYREFQDFRSTQTTFQSPPPLPPFEQRGLQYQDWGHVVSNAPPPPIVSALPTIQEVHREPSIADNFVTVQRSLLVKSVRPDPGPDILFLVFGSDKSPAAGPLQPRTGALDQVRNFIPSGNEIFGIESTLSGLPIASQILSPQTNTVAALTAVAREVALQEFSLKLFQPNAISTPERASVDHLRAEPMQPEIADGFIQGADELNVSQIVSASDVAAREREAVDAVLEDLHDIDTFRPATSPGEIIIQIGGETEAALDELPGGEVDGGMVLLQAIGDANESRFEMTSVYAENVDESTAPAKIETSVGMFQAVDVATDDAPIIDASQQVDPGDDHMPELKLHDNQPIRREQPSSKKAAAIVGVTTATGALVWLSWGGDRISNRLPTAQKRRAPKC